MENEKIARPWQPPNMSDQVADLIANDQLLQDMNIRGLASADSEEFRVAVDQLKGQLHGAMSRGYVKALNGMRPRMIKIAIASYLFGAAASAAFFIFG